jgi:hypothetical protein
VKVVITSLTALQQERDELRSVDMISGPYDVTVIVDVPEVDALGDLTNMNIKHIQDSYPIPREDRTIISPLKYSMKIQLSPA